MAEPTLLQEVVEIVRVGLARPQSLWQLLVIAVGLASWRAGRARTSVGASMRRSRPNSAAADSELICCDSRWRECDGSPFRSPRFW